MVGQKADVFLESLPMLADLVTQEAPIMNAAPHAPLALEACVSAHRRFYRGDPELLVRYIRDKVMRVMREDNALYAIDAQVRYRGERPSWQTVDELHTLFVDMARRGNVLQAVALMQAAEDEEQRERVLLRLAAQSDICITGHARGMIVAYLRLREYMSPDARRNFFTLVVQTLVKAIWAEGRIVVAQWNRTKFLTGAVATQELIPSKPFEVTDQTSLLELMRAGRGNEAIYFFEEYLDPEDPGWIHEIMLRAVEIPGHRRHNMTTVRHCFQLMPRMELTDRLAMWQTVIEQLLAYPDLEISFAEFDAMVQKGRSEVNRSLPLPATLTDQDTPEAAVAAARDWLEDGGDLDTFLSTALEAALHCSSSVHLVKCINGVHEWAEVLPAQFHPYLAMRIAHDLFWEWNRTKPGNRVVA